MFIFLFLTFELQKRPQSVFDSLHFLFVFSQHENNRYNFKLSLKKSPFVLRGKNVVLGTLTGQMAFCDTRS